MICESLVLNLGSKDCNRDSSGIANTEKPQFITHYVLAAVKTFESFSAKKKLKSINFEENPKVYI